MPFSFCDISKNQNPMEASWRFDRECKAAFAPVRRKLMSAHALLPKPRTGIRYYFGCRCLGCWCLIRPSVCAACVAQHSCRDYSRPLKHLSHAILLHSFQGGFTSHVCQEKNVFLSQADLNTITAGGIQNINVKMSYLQANQYQMQRMIEAFGKMNYLNGLKDEAVRRRQGS